MEESPYNILTKASESIHTYKGNTPGSAAETIQLDLANRLNDIAEYDALLKYETDGYSRVVDEQSEEQQAAELREMLGDTGETEDEIYETVEAVESYYFGKIGSTTHYVSPLEDRENQSQMIMVKTGAQGEVREVLYTATRHGESLRVEIWTAPPFFRAALQTPDLDVETNTNGSWQTPKKISFFGDSPEIPARLLNDVEAQVASSVAQSLIDYDFTSEF